MNFNKTLDFDVLPKGQLSDDSIDLLIEGARRSLPKEEDVTAYSKRLKVIQEYNPEVIAKGPNGFFGYIVFEFKELEIVLLESMYMGNATYVFDIRNYENIIAKNKQDVLNNNLALRRFFHYNNWEDSIRAYLAVNKKAA